MFAVTDQLLGPVACSVCAHPLIGLHTSFPMLVSDVVSVICESLYGPHDPFAALAEQSEDCGGIRVGAGLGAELFTDS
jgi:hypothetical protein